MKYFIIIKFFQLSYQNKNLTYSLIHCLEKKIAFSSTKQSQVFTYYQILNVHKNRSEKGILRELFR